MLDSGDLIAYLERGGRTVLTWSQDADALARAASALAALVRSGRVSGLTVERVDGEQALGSGAPLIASLTAAGFHQVPKGLRLRR